MHRNPVDQLMKKGLRESVFPGAVLLVAKGDGILHHQAYGKADLFSGRTMTRRTVFDLASLTKPLATALAVAKLAQQGRVSLAETVAHRLPLLDGSALARITVLQLLRHTSGLPAHRPYYWSLKPLTPEIRKDAVLPLLAATPLDNPPGAKHCYSDLGYMLLCRLIEAIAGISLHAYLQREVYGPMGLTDLFFIDLLHGRRPDHPYAATELCPIRNRLLLGEVHDDNAWFAGGIDGHAGLFGTAEALFYLLRKLVDQYHGIASPMVFSSERLSVFFQVDRPDQLPLGFDRPAARASSAGHYFSKRTIGHLGFTGVSFWLDLETDVAVVLLTNRVHPTRWNSGLAHFRPLIHDRIMEHFEIAAD